MVGVFAYGGSSVPGSEHGNNDLSENWDKESSDVTSLGTLGDFPFEYDSISEAIYSELKSV